MKGPPLRISDKVEFTVKTPNGRIVMFAAWLAVRMSADSGGQANRRVDRSTHDRRVDEIVMDMSLL